MQKSRVRYGTLSSDEFNLAARALSDRWRQIDPARPQWDWIPCSRTINGDSCLNVQNEGYLSMKGVDICDSDKVPSDKHETHVYDYHIVYSFSYRVPVLYFHGYQSGGQPLNLDDIQKDLPFYSLGILRDSKWTFMTQEEHPYLHRPWYTLHPCGTSEWMKLLLSTRPTDDSKIAGYLPAWLSVAAQAVGLKIPLELHRISLQEHPHLHRPWYTLHPCGTSEWMKLLLSTRPTDDSKIAGYLPAWLSVAAQAVGLKTPLELHRISLQESTFSSVVNV